MSDDVFTVVLTVLVLGIEVPSEDVLTGAALALEREKHRAWVDPLAGLIFRFELARADELKP